MIKSLNVNFHRDCVSLYILSRFAVVKSADIHFDPELTRLHPMTIKRIFLHAAICSFFSINAIAETNVSSVITIHEEDAISADVKDSENAISNRSSCQNEFAKKQSESLLLSASIALEVVNYCHNLNDFMHQETPERFRYIRSSEMSNALANYNTITEKILQANSKINKSKILECAKSKFREHEKILNRFFGSAPVEMKIYFLNKTDKEVSMLCSRSTTQLSDLRVKFYQKDFLKN